MLPTVVEKRSDPARAMLRSLLGADEHEVAFGRVEAREGTFALLTERRLLWAGSGMPSRVGVLRLSSVRSIQEIEWFHRWSARLRHEEITQRVHVPEHRVLWWAWGNAEAERTFTETTFRFSHRDTELARALRAALAATGAASEPTIRVETPPRSGRVDARVLVYRPVRRPRLLRYWRKLSFGYEDLVHGHLFWRWRLLGWALFGIPLWFLRPWLAVIGVGGFELLVVVLMRLSWRRSRIGQRSEEE